MGENRNIDKPRAIRTAMWFFNNTQKEVRNTGKRYKEY